MLKPGALIRCINVNVICTTDTQEDVVHPKYGDYFIVLERNSLYLRALSVRYGRAVRFIGYSHTGPYRFIPTPFNASGSPTGLSDSFSEDDAFEEVC